jgi:NhaP-type Na+/H+ or K+/H+ antiporter
MGIWLPRRSPYETPVCGTAGRGTAVAVGETEKERVDRELIELLNELRVALPGVQVLFAFLLTIPFSSRYGVLTAGQRALYVVVFIATFVATVLLTAPTAYHRLRFREGDKGRLLRSANRFAIAGIVSLAVALSCAALLVLDVVYQGALVWVATPVLIGLLVWCWFVLPLSRKSAE